MNIIKSFIGKILLLSMLFYLSHDFWVSQTEEIAYSQHVGICDHIQSENIQATQHSIHHTLHTPFLLNSAVPLINLPKTSESLKKDFQLPSNGNFPPPFTPPKA